MATPSPTPRRRTTRSSAAAKSAASKTVDVTPVASTPVSRVDFHAKQQLQLQPPVVRPPRPVAAALPTPGSGSGSKAVPSPAATPSPIVPGVALGMIETRGMVPAIEAADAMTKAAEVS